MDPETYPVDPETQNSVPPPKQKPRTLQEILNEFGDPGKVQFDPFQPEPHRNAYATLPPSFPPQPQPIDFFSLFLTDDLFQTITKNTNRYAAFQQRINTTSSCH
jgi:hypothetical protein